MIIAQLLAKEHRDIDAEITAFRASLGGGQPAADRLKLALATLRRHIYIEEEMLFPPMRSGRAFGAIMAMLREHGEMWPILDRLEPLAHAGGADTQVPELLDELEKLLVAHNDKEEKTVYADADEVLAGSAADELMHFVAGGKAPEGWKCDRASGKPKPPFAPQR